MMEHIHMIMVKMLLKVRPQIESCLRFEMSTGVLLDVPEIAMWQLLLQSATPAAW